MGGGDLLLQNVGFVEEEDDRCAFEPGQFQDCAKQGQTLLHSVLGWGTRAVGSLLRSASSAQTGALPLRGDGSEQAWPAAYVRPAWFCASTGLTGAHPPPKFMSPWNFSL